jgi:hypothetical protein
MIRLLLLATILLSQYCWAKDTYKVFVQHELNESDTITSIGMSRPFMQTYSKVQGELLTSIGYAEVQDKDQLVQHFVISDLGVRLGYYDKFYVYIEGGIDLLEILFQDFRDDDDFYADNNSDNTPDGYAALGAGLDAGTFKVEGFVKARNIDSEYWDSEHHIFYGVQFSLSF